MRNELRVATLVIAAALAVGCQKPDQAAQTAAPAAAAAVPVPTATDMESWKGYLRAQVSKHSDKKYRRPYVYFIPAGVTSGTPEEIDEAQRQYDAQLENAQGAVARGILAGSLLAFAGPESARTADVIVESFKLAGPSTLKNVRVVFVGAPADMERAKAAVDPSGAEFVFEEMK